MLNLGGVLLLMLMRAGTLFGWCDGSGGGGSEWLQWRRS